MDCLVLSAGGMFGAYQAGAWSVLSQNWRPDAVVGASAGSLNGWMIAGGVPARELMARWTDPRLAATMKWNPGWRGVFDPAPLEALVREMWERSKPEIPYGAAVVEVPALRLRLMRGEEMTYRHLLASCAIPLGYPPVRLDGKLYVDGGFLGALPLWAASEMGAARALAIDVLPRMPSRMVRFAVGMARRVAREQAGPGPAEVVRLTPSRPLGKLRDALHWNAANAEAWMELGARDAERLMPDLPVPVSHNNFV
jgi:predicted acylesterase/phospholipase RssA